MKLGVGLCVLFLTTQILPASAAEPEPEPVRVVRAQVEAFNRHDAEALASHVSGEVVWYNVTADALATEAKGRDALKAGMADYFKSVPTVHSEIDGVTCAGEFVTFRETASWTSAKSGAHSQACVAVYQVHAGLITRAWYYPAAAVAQSVFIKSAQGGPTP